MSTKKFMLTRVRASEASSFFNNLHYGESYYDGYSYEIKDSEDRVYEIDIVAHEVTRRKADTGFDPKVIDRINTELAERSVVDIASSGAVRYHLPVKHSLIADIIRVLINKLKEGPIPFMAGNKDYVLTPIGSVVGIYTYTNGLKESNNFVIVETDGADYLKYCNAPCASPVGVFMGKNILDVTSCALEDAMHSGQMNRPFCIDWI